MVTGAENRIIVWYRYDLRIHHLPLHLALSVQAQIIPLYCFDPASLAPPPLGFPKPEPFGLSFCGRA